MSNLKLKEVSEELGVSVAIRTVGGYFGNGGDFTRIERQKKIRAERRVGGKWEVKNADKVPTYEFITIGNIIALQTQRVVEDEWAIKVLNIRGGIDMLTFGALSVRYSKKKGKYQCFDGNGRMLLVEAMREELGEDFKIPCLVYNDITENKRWIYLIIFKKLEDVHFKRIHYSSMSTIVSFMKKQLKWEKF